MYVHYFVVRIFNPWCRKLSTAKNCQNRENQSIFIYIHLYFWDKGLTNFISIFALPSTVPVTFVLYLSRSRDLKGWQVKVPHRASHKTRLFFLPPPPRCLRLSVCLSVHPSILSPFASIPLCLPLLFLARGDSGLFLFFFSFFFGTIVEHVARRLSVLRYIASRRTRCSSLRLLLYTFVTMQLFVDWHL